MFVCVFRVCRFRLGLLFACRLVVLLLLCVYFAYSLVYLLRLFWLGFICLLLLVFLVGLVVCVLRCLVLGFGCLRGWFLLGLPCLCLLLCLFRFRVNLVCILVLWWNVVLF